MNVLLVINGDKYCVDVKDPGVREVVDKVLRENRSGYERVEENETYYVIDAAGKAYARGERNDTVDKENYKNANYYSNVDVSCQNARADKVMRQLRRFAVERAKKIERTSGYVIRKFFIKFNYTEGISVDSDDENIIQGVVYFDSEASAREAIEAFRDELIWYFKEYKDSL